MINFEEELKKFHPSLEVEDAEEAITSMPASAGPTHGVQAKLKVKPNSSAVKGFMESLSSLNGRRCSELSVLERKTPN